MTERELKEEEEILISDVGKKETEFDENTGKEKKIKRSILFLVILLILAGIIVALVLLLKKSDDDEEEEEPRLCLSLNLIKKLLLF